MRSSDATILVVDDDVAITSVVAGVLKQEGITAVIVGSGASALAALSNRPVDVVLTDLRMPGIDGMELLGRIAAEWPDVPVVMMTAYATVNTAVEAMKRGAADFVTKPFDVDELVFVLRKALDKARHASTRGHATGASGPAGITGSSAAIREPLRVIARAARTSATVLIRGESGTGKELAARALHDLSARGGGPFIAVNCAALPESLLESELFGYEKGAFTGAVTRKPGRVEMAEGGTLFLDEIGDVPPPVQVKLLRLLQESEYTPLGALRARKADVRFVTATHRDLEAMVAAHEFREDLFYRLAVVLVQLPPLRERAEDIPELAREFCARFAAKHDRAGLSLHGDAIAHLAALPWPGNVRQLQNFIERLVVMSDGPVIDVADVTRELKGASAVRAPAPSAPPSPPSPPPHDAPGGAVEVPTGGLVAHMRQIEREVLVATLARTRNNRTLAANVLGLSRRTFYNKLEEHGIP
ncbi:MAG: sigma-54 dependent transcriptional regulator [Polyangiales bacterium]